MTSLKLLRKEKGATQKDCAEILGVSLRSYKDYENNEDKCETEKYKYLLEKLTQHFRIDEENGILEIDDIKSVCEPIFKEYKVEYCYLFGSYAKHTATSVSDVDLLISLKECGGLKFFELVEVLRNKLHKKVDLLDLTQVAKNKELFDEILKTGVKIYG